LSKVRHASGLFWDETLGMGYFPVQARNQYGVEYWDNYQKYRGTSIGDKLTSRRISLVRSYQPSDLKLVDIGIGNGQFIDTYGAGAFGYDVNPRAIEWLFSKKIWWDPSHENPPSATFWDSLEHSERPGDLVKKVDRFIFISIPIFTSLDHVLRSKHFKKDEHFWYFTDRGLEGWMSRRGFSLITKNRMEEECGREDIGTFVFKRVSEEPPEVW
jgi:Methyltransferase domain